jgi:endonuclease III
MKISKITATRGNQILSALKKQFGEVRSELNFSGEYQCLISVMLSAQCTDRAVNRVTAELFKDYPDFLSLSQADPIDVLKHLRQINYYQTKTKNIIETAKIVAQNGNLVLTRPFLEALPGVGRKTASVVLSEMGVEAALAVDTHVFRVARRIGLAQANNREGVEEELRNIFPPRQWRDLHHSLILHGRYTCKARKPLCRNCPITLSCNFFSDQQVVDSPTL